MLRHLFTRHHILPGVFYSLPAGERLVVTAMAVLELEQGL